MPSKSILRVLESIEGLPGLQARTGEGVGAAALNRYLRRLKSNSSRAMSQALEVAAAWLVKRKTPPANVPWYALERPHMAWLADQLPSQYAEASVNKILAAVRGVVRAAGELGEAPARQVVEVASVPGYDVAQVPAVEIDQAAADRLFQECLRSEAPAATRDAAVLALLFATGLRRSELIALNVEHVDLDSGTLTAPAEKRDKERTILLPEAVLTYIEAWLEQRTEKIVASEPLITRLFKGGTVTDRRVTDQTIYNIVHDAGERAGVKNLTARIIRRACVISLIAAGHDVETVQRHMGHQSWVTTQAYGDLVKRDGKVMRPLTVPPLSAVQARSAALPRRKRGPR